MCIKQSLYRRFNKEKGSVKIALITNWKKVEDV